MSRDCQARLPLIQKRGCKKFWLTFLFGLSVIGIASGATAGDSAPSFLVDVWTADEGLPNGSISSLAQTPDGYLWIGTNHGGLVRFDGLNFTRPKGADGSVILGREVLMLDVDEYGTLWVVMNGPYRMMSYRDGVFKSHYGPIQETPQPVLRRIASRRGDALFTTTAGKMVRVKTGPGAHQVEALEVPQIRFEIGCGDGGKNTWFVGMEMGLAVLEGDSVVPKPFGGPMAGATLGAMACGPDGRLWIAGSQGLAVHEGGKFQQVALPGEMPVERVLQIAFSKDGGMWVRSETRIMKMLGCKWVVDVQPWQGNSGPRNFFVMLRTDADGGAWLHDAGRGLWHVDGLGRMESVGTQDGLPDTRVTCWLQDREGGIWVGTAGGLARLRPRMFDVVGTDQGLRHPVVRSIAEDASGDIWLSGTNGFGRWSRGKYDYFPAPARNAVNPVTDVLVVGSPEKGGTNSLWVGTVAAGAFEWKNDAPSYPFPPTRVGLAVRTICKDREERVWFGGEFGLHCWQNGAMRTYGVQDGLTAGYIFDIRENQIGDIWLSKTGSQICRLRQGRFESWIPADLPESLCLALLPDGPDKVWMGTLGGGLLRWHDGGFFRFQVEHGLPCDSISQLLDDGQGFLWAGTPQGIFRVSKSDLNGVAAGSQTSARFQSFGRNDGLLSIECSAGVQPAALRASDGRLWFSTMRGAVVVDPRIEISNSPPPPVMIHDVRLDGVVLPDVASVRGDARTLAPGMHTLEFAYAGLSLAAPEKVRYRRRLIGVDKKWVECGFQRSVSYGGLPPGDYRFEVVSCGQNGVWNPKPAQFEFSIEPHFWERNSFQLGSVLLLVLGTSSVAAGVQRARYRRRVAHAEARRALEVERARIARDLHDDLGAGLAQINISSGLLEFEGVDPEVVGPLVRDIGSRSRELIAALDEIVWAINPKNDTLISLATYLCQFAQNFLRSAQIACRLSVPLDLPDLPLDAEQRHGLFLAFAEAIHNAVRHSGATEVKVSIGYENGAIRLTVSDNGCGLPHTEPAEGADGLGNMHQRLAQLGGICRIHSSPSIGTEVMLFLPLIDRAGKVP